MVIRQKEDRIPEDSKIFIDHYLTILRRLTMQDDEIVKLCKAIYKKHKYAIDLIVESRATTQFISGTEEFLRGNNDLVILSTRPRSIWFIRKSWAKTMPACSDRWTHLSKPYPVACWFNFRPKSAKIGFVIEVGSMENSKKRLQLIKKFLFSELILSDELDRADLKFHAFCELCLIQKHN